MDLDQLQSVRDRERQTDRLQQLRDSFYEDAAGFVGDLRAERDEAAAAAADPFDDAQVNRLTDQIRTAEQTLEAVYEKRVGKVVKAATFAAADLPAEADGMTKEEESLFETLVAEIEANRAEVLGRLGDDGDGDHDVLSGTGASESVPEDGSDGADALGAADVMGSGPDGDRKPPAPEPAATDQAAPAPEEGVEGPADADPEPQTSEHAPQDPESGPPGPESGPADPKSGPADAAPDAPADAPTASEPVGAGTGEETADSAEDGDTGDPAGDGAPVEADVERELVRITDDVGPILGVDDREYDLSTDDVVTLPAENAQPLVERGAAERLE